MQVPVKHYGNIPLVLHGEAGPGRIEPDADAGAGRFASLGAMAVPQ